jgi:hypothetical protein
MDLGLCGAMRYHRSMTNTTPRKVSIAAATEMAYVWRRVGFESARTSELHRIYIILYLHYRNAGSTESLSLAEMILRELEGRI